MLPIRRHHIYVTTVNKYLAINETINENGSTGRVLAIPTISLPMRAILKPWAWMGVDQWTRKSKQFLWQFQGPGPTEEAHWSPSVLVCYLKLFRYQFLQWIWTGSAVTPSTYSYGKIGFTTHSKASATLVWAKSKHFKSRI